jgi:hypothetical protein
MARPQRTPKANRDSGSAPTANQVRAQAAREGLTRALETAGRWSVVAGRWSVVAGRLTAIGARRFGIASLAFWRSLTAEGGEVPTAKRARAPAAAPTQILPPALDRVPTDAALLLLGLFQKEGRLVDFLQEDVGHYSDQEVGAAARVVHRGCRQVLQEYLEIAPVRDEPEGSRVTLERGFDPTAMRPTGNVVGDPPITGTLVHRGWRASEVRLPQVASGRDLTILAAAEVEL